MKIEDAFKEQLDNTPPITQDIIDKLIESRKSNNRDYQDILDNYKIGSKLLYVMVEGINQDDGTSSLEMISIFDSDLPSFSKTHVYVPEDAGLATPRYKQI